MKESRAFTMIEPKIKRYLEQDKGVAIIHASAREEIQQACPSLLLHRM